MRKINWECLAQITILLVLDSLLFIGLITDKMKYYVHPRIEKYVWFSVIGLALIILSMVPMLFKPKHKNNILSCMILLIPIMTGFALPAASTSSSTSAGMDNVQKVQIQTDTSIVIQPSDREASQFEGNSVPDFITVSDEEYLDWYMDAYTNPAKYDGKTVKLKGFVFRMVEFNKNEFVPARMSMVCCAADLIPYGFICKSDTAAEWKNDQWVYVTAKIKVEYEPHMGMELPVLYATDIIAAEKPEEEFVYPY